MVTKSITRGFKNSKIILILISIIFINSCSGLKNISKNRLLHITTVLENIKGGNKKIEVKARYQFLSRKSIEKEVQIQVTDICIDEDNYSILFTEISSKWATDNQGLLSVLYVFNCSIKEEK